MATVHDVAAYILQKQSPMTGMKLQKLVYYSQAWSLVWDERPLFEETIEAWANGPVVRELYRVHRGKFLVSAGDVPGNASKIDEKAAEAIDSVLKFYGDKEPQWLSDLTHAEDPWKDARNKAGLQPGERGTAEISPTSLYRYYSAL